jgi:hypothetical protein
VHSSRSRSGGAIRPAIYRFPSSAGFSRPPRRQTPDRQAGTFAVQPRLFLEEHDYRFFVPTWIHEANGVRYTVGTTNAAPTDIFGLVEIGWQHRFLLANQIDILAYPAERVAELHRLFGA